MQEDLQLLLNQADTLRNGIEKMQQESYNMNTNAADIRACATALKKGIKKVGNNKLAALAARDKRKVYDEMEDAIDTLMELLDQ